MKTPGKVTKMINRPYPILARARKVDIAGMRPLLAIPAGIVSMRMYRSAEKAMKAQMALLEKCIPRPKLCQTLLQNVHGTRPAIILGIAAVANTSVETEACLSLLRGRISQEQEILLEGMKERLQSQHPLTALRSVLDWRKAGKITPRALLKIAQDAREKSLSEGGILYTEKILSAANEDIIKIALQNTFSSLRIEGQNKRELIEKQVGPFVHRVLQQESVAKVRRGYDVFAN